MPYGGGELAKELTDATLAPADIVSENNRESVSGVGDSPPTLVGIEIVF